MILDRVWFSLRAMLVNLRLRGRPFTTNWKGVIFSSTSSEEHVNLYVISDDSCFAMGRALKPGSVSAQSSHITLSSFQTTT